MTTHQRILYRILCLFVASIVFSPQAFAVSPYLGVQYLGPAATNFTGVKYVGASIFDTGTPNASLIPELSPNFNMVYVNYDPRNPTAINGVISQLNANMKAILLVNAIFMNADGSARSGWDAWTDLSILKSTLGSSIANVAYLGFDEPVWIRHMALKCLPSYTPTAECNYIGPQADVVAEVVPNIEQWANTIRTQMPGMGVFYVEAHTMVDSSGMTLPANVDLYAFDCYVDFFQCSARRAAPGTFTYLSTWDMFNIMKAKAAAFNSADGGFRKMALVPPLSITVDRMNPSGATGATVTPTSGPAQLWIDNRVSGPHDDAAVAAFLSSYINYSTGLTNDPAVLLIGGFNWASTENGTNMIVGGRGMPTVRPMFELLARQKLGRSNPPPSTAAPVIEFKVSSNVHAYQGATLFVWTTKDATSCRSLSEAGYQGMPPGGIGYRPPEGPVTPYTYTLECTGPNGTRTASATVGVSP